MSIIVFNVYNKLYHMSYEYSDRYTDTFRTNQTFMSCNIFAIQEEKDIPKLENHKKVNTCHANQKILMNEWNMNTNMYCNSLPHSRQRFNTLFERHLTTQRTFRRLRISFFCLVDGFFYLYHVSVKRTMSIRAIHTILSFLEFSCCLQTEAILWINCGCER